ncbi:MAG: hypothetical protein LBM08_04000 [Dysgonamonadaceae bacterium]|jgi:hypothetical protein|nr:hypothetical protein [Dysgonamonadaceae bacterium]
MATKDEFTRKWITENAIDIVYRYEKGILTIRGLHYQLVSIGMTNDMRHYKRVVSAMIEARWQGLIDFDAFSDNDRGMIGKTDYEEVLLDSQVEKGKEQVKAWMEAYYKNRWENQTYYPEVLIEKKALQGVFEKVCRRNDVALGACKGYPSLTFLSEATGRFKEAERAGKAPIIIYFGDYDPSGEDIPRSIRENIIKLGCESIEVRRIALMHEQVVAWNLPPAPVKVGDSRSANWNGLGQVELDAVQPEKLQQLCQSAIDDIFDKSAHDILKEQEETERETYQLELRKFVSNIA